jgi:hypothetical protein
LHRPRVKLSRAPWGRRRLRDIGIKPPWLASAAVAVPKEAAMSKDTAKTPLEHVNDTLAQLKEMRHYAKNNVEMLTQEWLLFEGELSKLEQTAKIEDLMERQGELYEALEKVIADLEELAVKLQPAPEEEQ